MTANRNCHYPCAQRGFVLVTSLIFLALVTLIAVSAIHKATSQQRMAANQRDVSQARQAANAGLRHAEQLLEQPAFYGRPQPGSLVAITLPGGSGGDLLSVRIWGLGANWSDALLDPASWDDAQSYVESPALAPVQYYVQYDCDPPDLYPDSEAKCDPGAVRFRLTARAHGRNPNAVAVSQSVYRIK